MNGYLETLKAQMRVAIEKQEECNESQYNRGREDAIKYAIKMYKKHKKLEEKINPKTKNK